LLQVQGGSYGFFRDVDDRGQYRLFGLLPGDYYIQTADMKSGDAYYYPGTFDVSKAESVHVGAGEEIQLGALTVPAKKAVRIRFRFKDAPGDLPAERHVYFEPELGFSISGPPLVRRDEIVSGVGAFGRRDVLVEWRTGPADNGELLFGHAVVHRSAARQVGSFPLSIVSSFKASPLTHMSSLQKSTIRTFSRTAWRLTATSTCMFSSPLPAAVLRVSSETRTAALFLMPWWLSFPMLPCVLPAHSIGQPPAIRKDISNFAVSRLLRITCLRGPSCLAPPIATRSS
jgi:hypothetical protein